MAEDRILCFELLARKDCNWTMTYVKDAIARTDVPTDLIALMGQRVKYHACKRMLSLFISVDG